MNLHLPLIKGSFWSFSFVFLAFLVISSCRPDDYPKRQFATCDSLGAELTYTSDKLACVFKLTSVTGTLESIEWDFGDGSKQTGLETTANHTYRQTNNYTVRVTLTDKCKGVITKTINVNVRSRENPAFTLISATNITSNSALVGIRFSNSGNPEVLQYGICYSYTVSTPTLENSTVQYFDNGISLNSDLLRQITSLQSNITYYYRAFAKTADSTFYSSNTLTFTTSAPPVDLTSGLVAYLPFNSNPFDATSNANNAFLGNGTGGRSSYIEGISGTAFRFDGSTYLKIEDSPSTRLRTQSVSFWFKPEVIPSATNQYQHLLYKANYDNDSNQEYSTSIDWDASAGVRFKADVKQNSRCISGQGWESLISNINLKSEWTHVVILYMSNKIVVYINGNPLPEKTLPFNTGIDSCTGGDLIIGAQSNRASNFYKGGLDELRIYNTTLTVNQIQALYNKR